MYSKKLVGLLFFFIMIVAMVLLVGRHLKINNERWESLQNGQKPKLIPFMKGGGDLVVESSGQNDVTIGALDIYENEKTDVTIKVSGIRVYYEGGKSNFLTLEDSEFKEWIDFKETEITIKKSHYEAVFIFEWGSMKGMPFDVYFTTDLDPGTVRKIQFGPAKP
jgi:hypothetical protein